MAAILAIDGGGSKTILATANRDGELGVWLHGLGVNPVDNPGWRDNLAALFEAAGDRKSSAGFAVLALPAFGEVQSVSTLQEQAVAHLLGCPHALVNDVDAAHAGAFAGGPGVLVLAGTGSMTWARDEFGNSLRVGGWGDAFGDEGSAHWIGREAIARVSRAIDGRLEAPALVDAVFSFLRLDSAMLQDALLQWHIGLVHQRSQIAAVATVVDRLAATGDPVAMGILDEAVDHLAAHVEAAWHRMSTISPGPWSYAGGVFASPRVLARLAARLGREPLPPRLPPIGGALLRAARDLDWPVDEAWIRRLGASIAKHAVRARNGLS
jgi:glucosamine kinase